MSQPIMITHGSGTKVLDADYFNVHNNGCKVQLHTPNGQKQQYWYVEPKTSDGWCLIRSAASGLVLDAHREDSDKNGCYVQLWKHDESKGFNQLWRFENTGGLTRLKNAAHGLFLDTPDGDKGTDPSPVELYEFVKSGAELNVNQEFLIPIGRVTNNKVFFLLDTRANTSQAPTIPEWPKTNCIDENVGVCVGVIGGMFIGGWYFGKEGVKWGAAIGAYLGESLDPVLGPPLTKFGKYVTSPVWEWAEGKGAPIFKDLKELWGKNWDGTVDSLDKLDDFWKPEQFYKGIEKWFKKVFGF